ncbi:MAG: hypothetical protein QXG48_06080 [Thermofilaceae archaeon]
MSEIKRLSRLVKEYLETAARIVNEARQDPTSWPYHVVRDAIVILQMSPQELESELTRLATQYGGCVSCRYSTPVPHYPSLLARWCRLGLAQDTCNHWEPLIGGEE